MQFPRIVLAILSFLAFFCLGLALPVDPVDTNSTSIDSRQYTVWPVSWPGANAVGCVPSPNLNDCFFGSSKWYSDKWAAVQAWDHNCVLLGSNDRIDSEQTFDLYSQLPYTMVAKYSNAQSRPSMAYAGKKFGVTYCDKGLPNGSMCMTKFKC